VLRKFYFKHHKSLYANSIGSKFYNVISIKAGVCGHSIQIKMIPLIFFFFFLLLLPTNTFSQVPDQVSDSTFKASEVFKFQFQSPTPASLIPNFEQVNFYYSITSPLSPTLPSNFDELASQYLFRVIIIGKHNTAYHQVNVNLGSHEFHINNLDVGTFHFLVHLVRKDSEDIYGEFADRTFIEVVPRGVSSSMWDALPTSNNFDNFSQSNYNFRPLRALPAPPPPLPPQSFFQKLFSPPPPPPPSPTNIVIVGQTNFDGQIVRLLQLTKGLPKQKYKVHYLTFSGEDPSTPNFIRVKAYFENAGSTFQQVLLPSVDVSYEDESTDKWDFVNRPSCRDDEMTSTCFSDGGVEYMIAQLNFNNTERDLNKVKPAFAQETWRSMIGALVNLKPNFVILCNTGLHQDKMVSAAVRFALPGVKIAVDLPNVHPPFGTDVDMYLSVSNAIASHYSLIASATTARPKPAPIYVLPPGVDESEFQITLQKDEQYLKVQADLENRGCSASNRASNSCVVAGFLGRLSTEKSLGMIISALNEVVNTIPNQQSPKVVLLIIGDGQMLESLQVSEAKRSERALRKTELTHSIRLASFGDGAVHGQLLQPNRPHRFRRARFARAHAKDDERFRRLCHEP